jgi:hypothetical protein
MNADVKENLSYDLSYNFIGAVEALPEKANLGDVILLNDKVYVYTDTGMKIIPNEDVLMDKIRNAVFEAEDSELRTKLLQIFKEHDNIMFNFSNS